MEAAKEYKNKNNKNNNNGKIHDTCWENTRRQQQEQQKQKQQEQTTTTTTTTTTTKSKSCLYHDFDTEIDYLVPTEVVRQMTSTDISVVGSDEEEQEPRVVVSVGRASIQHDMNTTAAAAAATLKPVNPTTTHESNNSNENDIVFSNRMQHHQQQQITTTTTTRRTCMMDPAIEQSKVSFQTIASSTGTNQPTRKKQKHKLGRQTEKKLALMRSMLYSTTKQQQQQQLQLQQQQQQLDGVYLPHDFVPSKYNVVVGQHDSNHVGNARFRVLVEMHLEQYQQYQYQQQQQDNNINNNNNNKDAILSKIVNIVKSANHDTGVVVGGGVSVGSVCDGGFVQYNTSTGRWYEISNEAARNHVERTFQEMMQQQQQENNNNNHKRRICDNSDALLLLSSSSSSFWNQQQPPPQTERSRMMQLEMAPSTTTIDLTTILE